MFDEVIDEFIPVPRLREYLKEEPINVSEVADIIYYARAPLQRKRDALLKLENMNIPKDRNSAWDFWLNYRKSVEEALSMMDSKDAVFVVYEYSLYENDIDSEEWMHGMMGDAIYPRISALYTADTYIPDLSDSEDAILAKVSELVAGDEKKGSELWDRFNASDISSDEKMWKIL